MEPLNDDELLFQPDLCTPPYGAGVLCYAVPPGSNEVFFLLGKESSECRPFIRKCWCDFGGKIEEGETEQEAASREFFEESMGLVCTEQCDDCFDSNLAPIHSAFYIDQVTDALSDNGYAFRICMCLNHGASPEIPRRYQITYVKQIPWNPNLPEDFAALRNKLCTLDILCEKAKRAKEILQEIDEEVDTYDTFFRTGQNMIKNRVREVYLVREESACKVIFERDDESAEKTIEMDFAGVNYTTYYKFFDSIRELQDYYEFLPSVVKDHPALSIGEDGLLFVKQEYLEKESIQYWSAERLRDTLRSGGYYKRELFRSSFIPTMAVVLDIFDRNAESERYKVYTIYCKPSCIREI
jgi:hypothetical protein